MSTDVRPFSLSVTIVTARTIIDSFRSPAFTVPVGLTFIRPIIDVSNQATAVSIALLLELSLDGGLTWPQTRSVSRDGGDTATEASFEWDLPEPGNPLRSIRATVTLTGGNRRLTSSVTIQAG